MVQRIERGRSVAESASVDAVLLMKPRNMFALTGYNTVIYSRPQFLLVPGSGQAFVVLPNIRAAKARESLTEVTIEPGS